MVPGSTSVQDNESWCPDTKAHSNLHELFFFGNNDLLAYGARGARGVRFSHQRWIGKLRFLKYLILLRL